MNWKIVKHPHFVSLVAACFSFFIRCVIIVQKASLRFRLHRSTRVHSFFSFFLNLRTFFDFHFKTSSVWPSLAVPLSSFGRRVLTPTHAQPDKPKCSVYSRAKKKKDYWIALLRWDGIVIFLWEKFSISESVSNTFFLSNAAAGNLHNSSPCSHDVYMQS